MYTIAALVVSHFAATVREGAVEAAIMKDQLSKLSRFMSVLAATRHHELNMELVVAELRHCLGLEYCALYHYAGKSGCASPVSSGIRPSSMLSGVDAGSYPEQSNSLIDVLCEEGSDCLFLGLSEQGKPLGMLIISRIPLSERVAEQLTGFMTFLLKHHHQFNQPVMS